MVIAIIIATDCKRLNCDFSVLSESVSTPYFTCIMRLVARVIKVSREGKETRGSLGNQ